MLSLVKGARPPGDNEVAPSRDELADLAVAVAGGDADAVRTFIIAIGGIVRGAVRMVLGPWNGEVDDVTQEATIGLLQALTRFRGECTVAQFARRVAVLSALAARRRQRTRQRWVVDDDPARDTSPSGPDSSPLAQIEASRRREIARRLLDELPAAMGEAMVLYYMLGHTAEEIAAMTQVPANTVWSRLRIGRERLRQKLASDVSLCEALGASEAVR